MPDPANKDENSLKRQSRHLPNGHEIDDADTVYFDRRLARKDCLLPDWDIPDTAYRPVPIVWFTGAMLLQLLSLAIIATALSSKDPLFTIVCCSVSSFAIGYWTWERGMKDAGTAWKISTFLMLVIQFAFLYAVVSIGT